MAFGRVLRPSFVLMVSSCLAAFSGHCQTPSNVICYEDDGCPHAYKNGKLVEIVQQPDVTILVSMQQQLGMIEVEIALKNTSNSPLDVIPTQVFGESIQDDAKHPRQQSQLAQISRDELVAHSYSSATYFPSPPAPQESTTTGQIVVVGPQGHSVYSYSATGESTPLGSSQAETITGITPAAFAAANALTSNTLAPQQTLHGMVYFALPPRHTVDAGVQVLLGGKWYEFHFAWPRSWQTDRCWFAAPKVLV